MLACIACGEKEDKKGEDNQDISITPTTEVSTTPIPRTTLTIGTEVCEDWLKPYVKGFNESQAEYELSIVLYAHYDEKAKYQSNRLFLEQVRRNKADMSCLLVEQYEDVKSYIASDEQESFVTLFVEEDAGGRTIWQNDEYTIVMLEKCAQKAGVLAFLEYMEENAK